MTRNIETPRISEILWEEFMKPLGISAYQLAKELHVPPGIHLYITSDKLRLSEVIALLQKQIRHI